MKVYLRTVQWPSFVQGPLNQADQLVIFHGLVMFDIFLVKLDLYWEQLMGHWSCSEGPSIIHASAHPNGVNKPRNDIIGKSKSQWTVFWYLTLYLQGPEYYW